MSVEMQSQVDPGPGEVNTHPLAQQQAARRIPSKQTPRSSITGSAYYWPARVTADPEQYADDAPGLTPVTAWELCNLLTLDGGGIRGYWSLLALNQLMTCIAACEQRHDANVRSSFHPEQWHDTVSQVPLAPEECERTSSDSVAAGSLDVTNGPKPSRRYLPCHYFDYIGGSSTGSLIAIMLGRLRMTVLDCLDEYERLGGLVFGAPRFLWQITLPFSNRTKFSAKKVQRVFKDVVARRGEKHADATTFQSKSHTCKTFVTTLAKTPKEIASTLYLIRSYDLLDIPQSAPNSRQNSSRNEADRLQTPAHVSARQINRGPADNFLIWKVARAATAAPFYFDPLEVKSAGRKFTDGGFGKTNNPTREGINEILEAEPTKRLGCVVSVGTARHSQAHQREKYFITSKVKSMLLDFTDPEAVHKEVKAEAKSRGFAYYRMNPRQEEEQHLLTMGLDEWSPKSGRSPGSATLKEIRQVFQSWYVNANISPIFQDCAADLVRIRRARSEHDQYWPRYALAAEYKCRKPCKKKGRGFSDIIEFRIHLEKEHGMKGPRVLEEEIKKCRHVFEYSTRRNSSRVKGKHRH